MMRRRAAACSRGARAADAHPATSRAAAKRLMRFMCGKKLAALFAIGQLSSVKPLIIGIAGGTGSGKSTVARKVAEALVAPSVGFIEMDAYYNNYAHLTMDERRRINWDHPNSFDWDLLLAHMHDLAAGRAIDKPEYDFVRHLQKSDPVHVPAGDVVVVDGSLLLADRRTRELCDVKVFVDTDADIRLIRRLRRDL